MRLVHVMCCVCRPRRVGGADRMRAGADWQGSRQNRAGPPGGAEQANRRVFDPKLALSCHLGQRSRGPQRRWWDEGRPRRGVSDKRSCDLSRDRAPRVLLLRPCVTPVGASSAGRAGSSAPGGSDASSPPRRVDAVYGDWRPPHRSPAAARQTHLPRRPADHASLGLAPGGEVRAARRAPAGHPGACRGPGGVRPPRARDERSGALGSHLALPSLGPGCRSLPCLAFEKASEKPVGNTPRVTPRAQATVLDLAPMRARLGLGDARR